MTNQHDELHALCSLLRADDAALIMALLTRMHDGPEEMILLKRLAHRLRAGIPIVSQRSTDATPDNVPLATRESYKRG